VSNVTQDSCRYPDNTPLTGWVWGCRCRRCRGTATERAREYRSTQRLKAARRQSEIESLGPVHGPEQPCRHPDRKATTSYGYGCRCWRCKDGWAEYNAHARANPNRRPKAVDCGQCGAHFTIAPAGVIPKKCPSCRQADRAAHPTVMPCRDCGKPSHRKPSGRPNARCDECRAAAKKSRTRNDKRDRSGRSKLSTTKPWITCKWCGQSAPDVRGVVSRQTCGQCEPPKPKEKPKWQAKVIACACGVEFTQKNSRHRRCSDCRLRSTAEAVSGLYWMAVDAGLVKQATAWRSAIVRYLRHRDGDKCAYCNKAMYFGPSKGRGNRDPRMASIDHVIPRSCGGQHELSNLQLMCLTCNMSKSNRGRAEQLQMFG
jgi:hypothetical protein